MGVQRLGGSVPVTVPDGAQNVASRAYGSGVFGQVVEELKLLDRHVDFGAVHEHAPGSLVDAERADLPGASGSSLAVPTVVLRAPCHGPDPGYEFAHSERLDQIIVGAQLQSQYAVNFLVAGADNNDRGRGQS